MNYGAAQVEMGAGGAAARLLRRAERIYELNAAVLTPQDREVQRRVRQQLQRAEELIHSAESIDED